MLYLGPTAILTRNTERMGWFAAYLRMRMIISVSFIALAAVLIAATPARLDSIPDEISRLDECIQLRFLDAKAFGMRRILPMQYHGLRTFQPENATERAVVDQLRQKGYEVAFYLVGRNALTDQTQVRMLNPRRSPVQGPAFITPIRAGEFPQPDTLLDDGRRALLWFQKGEGYDIGKAAWTVAMRPLRASNQGCVQCHVAATASAGDPKLKIGDALGVALYVYR